MTIQLLQDVFFSENDIKPIHVCKELTYPCPAKDERYKRWGDGEEINETEREPCFKTSF